MCCDNVLTAVNVRRTADNCSDRAFTREQGTGEQAALLCCNRTAVVVLPMFDYHARFELPVCVLCGIRVKEYSDVSHNLRTDKVESPKCKSK